MTDELRVGLIGTGGIAGRHVGDLQGVDGAGIVALVDPDPNRIGSMKKRFPALVDCPAYEDYRDMLAADVVDAAIICSPHNVHCEQILACLDAGLHVLCEKPMVCTIEDGHKVVEREEQTGKIVAVAYQRHSQTQFQFIRNRIRSGRTGEVQFISAFQGQNWLRLTSGSWRQIPEVSCGGQLNDSGSHLIDIILWTTGLKAGRVSAQIQHFSAPVDINSGLTVEFTNGAVANIGVVGNCPLSGMWEDITFVCEDSCFFLRQGELTYTVEGGGETLKMVRASYGGGSPAENFVDAIRGRAEVLAPSVCGLRTIELTEAAWRSAESGKPVEL